MSDEKIKEFNPPKGWVSEPPPDDPAEAEALAEEFGEPDDNGVYAPHIAEDRS